MSRALIALLCAATCFSFDAKLWASYAQDSVNTPANLTGNGNALSSVGSLYCKYKPVDDPSGGLAYLFDNRDAAGENMLIVRNWADTWSAGWISATNDYRLSASPTGLSTGTWYDILLTWDDTNNDTRLYIDASEVGTQSVLVTNSSTSTKYFGNNRNGDGEVTAVAMKLAHCAIWNVELTSANANSLETDCPSIVQGGSLVSYWPLSADADDDVGTDHLTASSGIALDSGDNPSCSSGGGGGPLLGGMLLKKVGS